MNNSLLSSVYGRAVQVQCGYSAGAVWVQCGYGIVPFVVFMLFPGRDPEKSVFSDFFNLFF